MANEPEDHRNSHAEKKAGDNREIKSGVFAAVDDVAGKVAKPEGQLSPKVEKCAHEDENASENEKGTAEFAQRFHGKILPQAAENFSKSFLYYFLNKLARYILLA